MFQESEFKPGIEKLKKEGERIWLSSKGELEVIVPQEGTIPRQEGTHLGIKPVGKFNWKENCLDEITRSVILSLGVAKVVAESRATPDFWVNIHMNSKASSDQRINVWGKRPESPSGWAKPVVIREGVKEEERQSIDESIKRTLQKYLPRWEKLAQEIRPFKEGVKKIDPQSQEFTQLREEFLKKKNEEVIWANDKFILVNVLKPHLNGLHLVVHPREDYWQERGGVFRRPWQQKEKTDLDYIQAFIEANLILVAIERLLREAKMPFYNPEIHFSGNWAKDLLPKELGGRLERGYLKEVELERRRKEEKRAHKVGRPEEFRTEVHGHLYLTDNPQAFLTLPERPVSEVPKQWEGIKPTDPALIEKIKENLDQNLVSYLEKNLS